MYSGSIMMVVLEAQLFEVGCRSRKESLENFFRREHIQRDMVNANWSGMADPCGEGQLLEGWRGEMVEERDTFSAVH